MAFDATAFQYNRLREQGYDGVTDDEMRVFNWTIRFTPTLCMVLMTYAYFMGIWWMNIALGLIGGTTFLFGDRGGPFDWLFNNVVRHAVGAGRNPPAPINRKIACVIGGSLNIGIGLALLWGYPTLALGFFAATFFAMFVGNIGQVCLVSLSLLGIRQLLGLSTTSLATTDEVKDAVSKGAIVVDVRNPEQFAEEHLENARNIPLADLGKDKLNEFGDKSLMFYGETGVKSNAAKRIMKRSGMTNVMNLGSIGRARQALQA